MLIIKEPMANNSLTNYVGQVLNYDAIVFMLILVTLHRHI